MDAKSKREDNGKHGLLKETTVEFFRSLLVGIIPVGLDYFFSAVMIFFLALKGLGYSFFETFSVDSGIVTAQITAIATAVGYLLGFIASYLFSVFFVFKHNRKGRTLKGILIYIGVEIFIYGLNVLLGAYLPRVFSYTLAFIVRIVVSYIFAFILRKLLIFMPEKNIKK